MLFASTPRAARQLSRQFERRQVTNGAEARGEIDDKAPRRFGISAHDLEYAGDLDMAVWGERTFLIADPDGYAVLLAEPIGTMH